MKLKITASILCSIALVFLTSCKNFQKEIVISRDCIQKIVDPKFPVYKDAMIAGIAIDSPVVYFKAEHIGMRLKYTGNFLDKQAYGLADFNGQIIYNSDEGAFYLADFNIINLTFNNVRISNEELLKTMVSALANKVLTDFPVYHLKQDNFKQKLTKMLIKDVTIKNDNLVITMGI